MKRGKEKNWRRSAIPAESQSQAVLIFPGSPLLIHFSGTLFCCKKKKKKFSIFQNSKHHL